MILVFSFFITRIFSLKRNVPVISIFCLYLDSSFSNLCESIEDQYNDVDKLIAKYQDLLYNVKMTLEYSTNLTAVNIDILQNRASTYQKMIDLLKYMGAPKSSKFTPEIAEIEKTTEILYIFQYGSMDLKKEYDFTNLKNSMIVDISTSNNLMNVEIF